MKSGTIRRVGAHRRWDAEGLSAVRGVPWHWDPESDKEAERLLVRHLTDSEKEALQGPIPAEGARTVYRMRLKRDDFIQRGFTDGCPGCRAILAGHGVRGHTEQCRTRMESLMQQSREGKERLQRQADKENEFIARRIEESERAEQPCKRPKRDPDVAPEGGEVPAIPNSGANSGEPIERENLEKRGREETTPDTQVTSDGRSEATGDALPSASSDAVPSASSAVNEPVVKRAKTDAQDMDVSTIERLCQDDMRWTVDSLDDMCEAANPELERMSQDYSYYDENTWESLDPKQVQQGEKEEYERFCKMCVYEYIERRVAQEDGEGKFVKVTWVRTKKALVCAADWLPRN